MLLLSCERKSQNESKINRLYSDKRKGKVQHLYNFRRTIYLGVQHHSERTELSNRSTTYVLSGFTSYPVFRNCLYTLLVSDCKRLKNDYDFSSFPPITLVFTLNHFQIVSDMLLTLGLNTSV